MHIELIQYVFIGLWPTSHHSNQSLYYLCCLFYATSNKQVRFFYLQFEKNAQVKDCIGVSGSWYR